MWKRTRCQALCIAQEWISLLNHINLSNGNWSQITWVTWKTILVKSPFISIQCRTTSLIAWLRLLIYIELNQYWAVVWWDQFPEAEVCHWTWHQGTSVPNPCLNFKWVWTSLFFTWPLHSNRPQTKVTWLLSDHMQDFSANVWDSD